MESPHLTQETIDQIRDMYETRRHKLVDKINDIQYHLRLPDKVFAADDKSALEPTLTPIKEEFVKVRQSEAEFWSQFPMATATYDEEVPDYAYVLEVHAFHGMCECGGFIDYDGFGTPVKDGKAANITISPSTSFKIPLDATHIAWYNR